MTKTKFHKQHNYCLIVCTHYKVLPQKPIEIGTSPSLSTGLTVCHWALGLDFHTVRQWILFSHGQSATITVILIKSPAVIFPVLYNLWTDQCRNHLACDKAITWFTSYYSAASTILFSGMFDKVLRQSFGGWWKLHNNFQCSWMHTKYELLQAKKDMCSHTHKHIYTVVVSMVMLFTKYS